MKYAFMRDHRSEFLIGVMCDILEASRSGFFAWIKRDHGAKAAKRLELVRQIEQIHLGSRGTYGSPRVLQVL